MRARIQGRRPTAAAGRDRPSRCPCRGRPRRARWLRRRGFGYRRRSGARGDPPQIAEPMGWSIERAAWGILRLATANMAEMVRLATLRRDSIRATSSSSRLAAPVRYMRRISPAKSAWRALSSRRCRDSSVRLGRCSGRCVTTWCKRALAVFALTRQDIEQEFKGLEARAALIAEEDAADDWQFERSADLRFEGQLFELTVSITVRLVDGLGNGVSHDIAKLTGMTCRAT